MDQITTIRSLRDLVRETIFSVMSEGEGTFPLRLFLIKAGIAQNMQEATRLILHQHVDVNGRTAIRPTDTVRPGEIVRVRGVDHRVPPIQGNRLRPDLMHLIDLL